MKLNILLSSVVISSMLLTSSVFANDSVFTKDENLSQEGIILEDNSLDLNLLSEDAILDVEVYKPDSKVRKSGDVIMSLSVSKLSVGTFINSSNNKTYKSNNLINFKVYQTSYSATSKADVGFIYYSYGNPYINGGVATVAKDYGSTGNGWVYGNGKLNYGYIYNSGSVTLKNGSYSIIER